MKNVLILLLLFFPITSFSQDTIKLPKHVVKLIVKDLIAFEGAKAELELCNEQVKLLESKVNVKDSIISVYEQKETNYKLQVDNEKEKVLIYRRQYKELKMEHKKLKKKLFFNQLGSGIVIGFFAYLLITN